MGIRWRRATALARTLAAQPPWPDDALGCTPLSLLLPDLRRGTHRGPEARAQGRRQGEGCPVELSPRSIARPTDERPLPDTDGLAREATLRSTLAPHRGRRGECHGLWRGLYCLPDQSRTP